MTEKVIICPACQKEMVKVFIPTKNIYVDICLNGCGGIFFDNREFKFFDELKENMDEIAKAYEGKTFEPVGEYKTRTCPRCTSTMVKNSAALAGEIEVDDCYYCGGKFLDFGELEKIRQMNEIKINHKIPEALYYNDNKIPSKKSFMKNAYDKLFDKIKKFI